MEVIKDILDNKHSEQHPQPHSGKDKVDENDVEEDKIVFSSSAFRPVKPLAESSSFPQRPPFLPTSSPAWYSSLLSSLYRTGTEQFNNIVEDTESKGRLKD